MTPPNHTTDAAREAGQTLFRLETEYPLAGRGATLTLKEWKRVYGFPEMLLGRGKLVEAEAPARAGSAQRGCRSGLERTKRPAFSAVRPLVTPAPTSPETKTHYEHQKQNTQHGHCPYSHCANL